MPEAMAVFDDSVSVADKGKDTKKAS